MKVASEWESVVDRRRRWRRLAASGLGGETKLFLGGLLRALCMRLENPQITQITQKKRNQSRKKAGNIDRINRMNMIGFSFLLIL
jgi:hypothetical protein